MNITKGGIENTAYYSNNIGGTTTVAGGIDNHGYAYYLNYGGNTFSSGDINNRENANLYTMRGGSLIVAAGNINNQDSATFDVHDATSAVSVTAGNFVNSGNATVNVWNLGTLGVASGTYQNTGNSLTQVTSGGQMIVATGLTNQDTASVNVNTGGSIHVLSGNYQNSSSTVIGSPTDATGSITVGGDYVQTGAGSLTKNYGTLQANNINVEDGVMGGPGTFIGTLNVTGAGIFNVGDPQISHVIGDFNVGPTGTVILNIDGTGGPGVGNDLLSVTGNLQLGGTLELEIGPGYNPSGIYQLFSFGSYSGNFTTIEELLPNGTIVPLQGTLNFGKNGAQFDAVPEPATVALFAVGGLALLLRRKR